MCTYPGLELPHACLEATYKRCIAFAISTKLPSSMAGQCLARTVAWDLLRPEQLYTYVPDATRRFRFEQLHRPAHISAPEIQVLHKI